MSNIIVTNSYFPLRTIFKDAFNKKKCH